MEADARKYCCCSCHSLLYDLLRSGVPSLGERIPQLTYSPSSLSLQYVSKGRYVDAYKSMLRLRATPIQATRDIFYMNALLEAEADIQKGRNLFLELFRVPRNRRATQASALVMFMQQFCGVNVIAYYSTTIFLQAGFSRTSALLVTMGTGLVNWFFAIPALYTSALSLYGRCRTLLIHGSPQSIHSEDVIFYLPPFP